MTRFLQYLAGTSAIAVVFASMAMAGAPDMSLHPRPRPVASVSVANQVQNSAVRVYYKARIRPHPRPVAPAIERPLRAMIITDAPGVRWSIRPRKRPSVLRRTPEIVRVVATRTQPSAIVTTGRAGSVCGDPKIRGQRLSPIRGRLAGCRISNPVKVTSIDGITLSQPAIIECATARALKKWIRTGARPAVGRLGGGIRSLRVIASYSCRTRNSQPGAKLSEHAKGKAVDIGAITLKNGMTLSVLKGWRDPVQGKILRRMHKSACGTFGTVLGPNANRFHRDHFHFDVARYRKGSYCR